MPHFIEPIPITSIYRDCMSNTFTSSASSAHSYASGHPCASAMIELLLSISEANEVPSDTFVDLPIVLRRAISVVSLEASRCQFCPKANDLIRIADRIQTRWSTYRLKAYSREFMEGIQNDCRTLKDLLQFIIEHEPSTASGTSILGGAHDNRINGAKFNNVRGNYTVNSNTNTFILIKQESGIGVGSVIVVLILAFLFIRWLL